MDWINWTRHHELRFTSPEVKTLLEEEDVEALWQGSVRVLKPRGKFPTTFDQFTKVVGNRWGMIFFAIYVI